MHILMCVTKVMLRSARKEEDLFWSLFIKMCINWYLRILTEIQFPVLTSSFTESACVRAESLKNADINF